jgi:hypothetical protein
MPISEKITSELSKLPITENEKKLMEDILFHEDIGTAHYSSPYEQLIKKYLENNPPKKGGKKK